MPAPIVNTADIIAQVERTKTLVASLQVFLAGITGQIQAAVAAALAADDAADQGSVDVANAAIATAVTDLQAQNDAIAVALVANTPNA